MAASTSMSRTRNPSAVGDAPAGDHPVAVGHRRGHPDRLVSRTSGASPLTRPPAPRASAHAGRAPRRRPRTTPGRGSTRSRSGGRRPPVSAGSTMAVTLGAAPIRRAQDLQRLEQVDDRGLVRQQECGARPHRIGQLGPVDHDRQGDRPPVRSGASASNAGRSPTSSPAKRTPAASPTMSSQRRALVGLDRRVQLDRHLGRAHDEPGLLRPARAASASAAACSSGRVRTCRVIDRPFASTSTPAASPSGPAATPAATTASATIGRHRAGVGVGVVDRRRCGSPGRRGPTGRRSAGGAGPGTRPGRPDSTPTRR